MSARTLTLVIVTPDGTALREEGVDEVVVHRREPRFDVGSEIAVFPGHAPLLVRLPRAPARYVRAGETVRLALDGGFAQVMRDRVLVVTEGCEVAK